MATTHPLLEAARSLAPRIAAAAERIDAERRIPQDIVDALLDAGLYRLLVPLSLGGFELCLSDYAGVIEEIAKADGSTAWCIAQNSGICRVAAYMPPEGAAEVFGDPRAVRSWGNGPASAVKVDGGYRLTGRWVFASGVRNATWIGGQHVVLAHPDGSAVLDDRGARVERTFLFPQREAAIIDAWQVSGMRGTASDTYSVTGLFVPDRHVAAKERYEPGTLYLFNLTNIFAVGFASVSLGIARGSLDALLDLAGAKTARDQTGTMREQPTVQVHIARCEAKLRSARAFLHQTLDEAWERVEASQHLDLETRILIRLATTSTIERSAEVVDTAYHLAGTTSIFTANAFERRFRDMHAATQHIQAREDHYMPVGQFFLGLEPSTLWL